MKTKCLTCTQLKLKGYRCRECGVQVCAHMCVYVCTIPGEPATALCGRCKRKNMRRI